MIQGFLVCVLTSCAVANGLSSESGRPEANDDSANDGNVCRSWMCKYMASTITENMDPRVDPCDDFYGFACGGFNLGIGIPAMMESISSEERRLKDLAERLRTDIADWTKSETSRPVLLLKTLYSSCTNEGGHDRDEALRNFLKNNFGGWPVLGEKSWIGTNFDWRRPVHKFREDRPEVGPLINARIEQSAGDAPGILTLGPYRGFAYPGAEFQDAPIQHYYRAIASVAISLGADPESAASQMRETVELEIKLANLAPTDGAPNVRPIAALSAQYPHVPWRTYIAYFVGRNIRISKREVVNVPVPEYYARLEALMAKTPVKTIANLVASRIALRNAVYAGPRTRDAVFNFTDALTGGSIDRDPRVFCSNQAIAYFWLPYLGLFARTFSNLGARSSLFDTTAEIERGVDATLTKINVTEDEANSWTLGPRGNDAIEAYNVYPAELHDENLLSDSYENLGFNEYDFFGNMEKLANLKRETWMRALLDPVAPKPWTVPLKADLVTPGYLDLSGTLPIPVALLKASYASEDQPRYVGYAAIGKSYGYEVVRGSRIWQQWATREKLVDRGYCVVQQYTNYIPNSYDFKPYGARVFEESISEIVATRAAYAAYVDWLSTNNATEKKLPGLEKFTSEQMFWLVAGATRCVKYSERVVAAGKALSEGETSLPAALRLHASVLYAAKFADAFDCPKDARMRARARCPEW